MGLLRKKPVEPQEPDSGSAVPFDTPEVADVFWSCNLCGGWSEVFQWSSGVRSIRHQCPDGHIPGWTQGELIPYCTDEEFEEYRTRLLEAP
jgi:hypothetical protein